MSEDSHEESMGHIATKLKHFFCPEKEKSNEKAPPIIKKSLSSETSNESQGQKPLAVSDSEEYREQITDCHIKTLECKLLEQQQLVEEHENKIRILEDIIQRQLLVIKEKDSTFTREDSVEKKDESISLKREDSIQSLNSTDSHGVLDFLEDVVESVENAFSDKSIRALAKHTRNHEKELEKHEELLSKHDSVLDEQIMKLEQVYQLLEQYQANTKVEKQMKKQASEVAHCRKKLDEQNVKIDLAIKKQNKRMDDAWSAIWINIVTVILAVFFSKITSLWS